MGIWVAILLGLVQGLTEFLPVSSSGHLILLQRFFGLENNMLLFNIILHLATLCAVVFVFRKKIWELIRNPLCKTNYCLVIATAITCTIVVIFKDFIDSTMDAGILPITFLVTAIILFGTSFLGKRKAQAEITYKTSIIGGIVQGIAVIPGISRSGSTIAACIYSGAERNAAAEFSFLMSIPIIIASFLFEIVSNPGAVSAVPILPLIFGFAAALVSGIFAIKVMMKIIKSVKLYWFSIYLVILSVVLIFVFYL